LHDSVSPPTLKRWPIVVVAGQEFPEKGQAHEQSGHNKVDNCLGKRDEFVLIDENRVHGEILVHRGR
jgi:hypothetical protein